MEITKTTFKDLYILKPKVFGDERGYFFESYNQKNLSEHGLDYIFVQDNQSYSAYGTLRGLHFQKGEFAQTKLIRVLSGKILDVVVDMRPESKTFKQYYSIELSSENFLQLLVPKGFAHGFVVLSDNASISYKCDAFYSPENEGGVHYADPSLNIDWKVHSDHLILSEKDQMLPDLKQALQDV